MAKFSSDYADRVYAGVLGKIIGVYLGRPFEQRPHGRIMDDLGEVRYYVNARLNVPLVVSDDDISGTSKADPRGVRLRKGRLAVPDGPQPRRHPPRPVVGEG